MKRSHFDLMNKHELRDRAVKFFRHSAPFGHALVITGLLFLLIPVLILDPLEKVASVKTSDESVKFDMPDLYHIVYANRNPEVLFDDIQIVYTDDCRDRREIAGVIETVARKGPAVIGVDLMFPYFIDVEADSLLWSVLQRYDNVVVCCKLNDVDEAGFALGRERYVLPWEVDAPEGFINLEGSGGGSVIRNFKPVLFFEGDTIFSFAMEIVRMVGPEIFYSTLARGVEPDLIDFRVLRFETLQPEELVDKDLEGKIVLIGTERGDWHNTPIHPQLQGVKVHAYTIATLLKMDQVKVLHSSLLVFVVTYVFSLCCFFLLKRLKAGSALVIRILQFVFLAGLLLIGYFLFMGSSRLNVELTHLLLAIGFASLATDIYLGCLLWGGKLWNRFFRKE